MAFTYDLTTNIGKVRFRIGDTIENTGPGTGVGPLPDKRNITDEEITMALNTEGSVERAIALIYEALAAAWATVVDLQLGPRKEAFSKVADRFASLANDYRKSYGGGGTSFSLGWTREDAYHVAALLGEYNE